MAYFRENESEESGKQAFADTMEDFADAEAEYVESDYDDGFDNPDEAEEPELSEEELKKIRRILAKEYDDSAVESLIVLDGTTGQNALAQVREFVGASQVDGIILTKMDGTAKGGIAVAIEGELGVPVKFIGFGEGIGDLSRFDPEAYVAGLFREEEK